MIRLVALFGALALGACTVPQSDWSQRMIEGLPGEMCRPGQYYNVCFDLHEEQCTRIVQDQTRACIEQMRTELPKHFNARTGSSWGRRVTTCVSEDLRKRFEDQKLELPGCDDPLQTLRNNP